MMPPIEKMDFRVTFERSDGVRSVCDVLCVTREEAAMEAERWYHGRHDEPCDGTVHWITRVVLIDRGVEGVPA